jgi:hypothetical protein
MLDDDDVIEIVNEIKGGPNSAAFVGNKKVQKTDLDHRFHPPNQTSWNDVEVPAQTKSAYFFLIFCLF